MKRFISGLSALLWLVIGTFFLFMLVIAFNASPDQDALANMVLGFVLKVMLVGLAAQILLGAIYGLYWFFTTDHTADFTIVDNFSSSQPEQTRRGARPRTDSWNDWHDGGYEIKRRKPPGF